MSLYCLMVCLSLLLHSCVEDDSFSGEDDNNNPPSTNHVPQPADNVDQNIILNIVNQYRSSGCQCGNTFYPSVPPLNWSDKLGQSSYNHSTDMENRNYFSHTGQNGSNPGERIRGAGYDWQAYGENIAQGYSSEQQVIQAWIESPNHCKNIMNGTYEDMGVGRSGAYWTQDFGLSF